MKPGTGQQWGKGTLMEDLFPQTLHPVLSLPGTRPEAAGSAGKALPSLCPSLKTCFGRWAYPACVFPAPSAKHRGDESSSRSEGSFPDPRAAWHGSASRRWRASPVPSRSRLPPRCSCRPEAQGAELSRGTGLSGALLCRAGVPGAQRGCNRGRCAACCRGVRGFRKNCLVFLPNTGAVPSPALPSPS